MSIATIWHYIEGKSLDIMPFSCWKRRTLSISKQEWYNGSPYSVSHYSLFAGMSYDLQHWNLACAFLYTSNNISFVNNYLYKSAKFLHTQALTLQRECNGQCKTYSQPAKKSPWNRLPIGNFTYLCIPYQEYLYSWPPAKDHLKD